MSNLVAIVDAGRHGGIEERLGGTGRLRPTRLIVCAVQQGRRTARGDVGVGGAGSDCVWITLGPERLPALDTIVDPLVAPDLATMVWSPHGHDEGVDALRALAHAVLIDSHEQPAAALARAADLARDVHVVDLAWLRSTPWRERVAALFDPVDRRRGLEAISGVTVRHREDSLSAALLLCGWLCSRLGWRRRG